MLVSLNSITQYLQCLNLVLKAVFHLQPSLMQIKLKALCRSIFVKITAPCNLSCISLINSNVYLSLIITLFSSQQFTTSLSFLFGLGINITSALASNVDLQINPFLRFVLRYSFKTSSSFLLIWQISLNETILLSLIGIL